MSKEFAQGNGITHRVTSCTGGGAADRNKNAAAYLVSEKLNFIAGRQGKRSKFLKVCVDMKGGGVAGSYDADMRSRG